MDHQTRSRSRPLGFLRWFLGVPLRPQTYKNLVYLLLAPPLGLFYFVFLFTAILTSGVLLIVLVGFPLFVCTLFAVRELAAGERYLAEALLDVEIPHRTDAPPSDAVGYGKDLFLDPGTWKGLLYLVSRWLIGFCLFIVQVMLGGFTLAALLVPLYYDQPNAVVGVHVGNPVELAPSIVYEVDAFRVGLTVPFQLTDWHVTTLPEALAFSLFGVLLALASLHLSNLLAWLHAHYARLMLRETRASEVLRILRS